MNSGHKNSPAKNSRYDDWLCLFCQNHNYSFRLVCTWYLYKGNRCHIQTKEQNAYMNQIYQQHLEFTEQQHLASVLAIDSFPNVLLLMINDDPWEEEQRRDTPETLNVKWINNLIEEWVIPLFSRVFGRFFLYHIIV